MIWKNHIQLDLVVLEFHLTFALRHLLSGYLVHSVRRCHCSSNNRHCQFLVLGAWATDIPEPTNKTCICKSLSDDYVVIRLRIEKGKDNFFVIPEQGSGDTAIIKDLDHIAKGFDRIFFSDLVFDNLTNLHPDFNIGSLQPSIDSELDIFNMLSKNEYLKKYVGITTVPSPNNAGVLFEERPELKALARYSPTEKVMSYSSI